MAITVDVLTGGSNNHETTSEAANAIATDFIGEGIVSTVANTSGVAPATGGFAVNAQGTPDMTVAVSSGVAYVTGTPTSQNSQQFRVKNSASSNVTISANASGSTKYDWVYISLSATNLNTPNTAGDNVATLTTSRSSSASTDDGTPPTYGYAIAVVTVANGETAITNSMIRDVRTQCGVSAGATTSTSTWTDTGYAPGTVTYNGNRSYQCVFSNTDLTGFLSNGMRLKLTRTTAPPTQCTDLEASSSQYWSKTSPTGISFTDDFTCMAWVKLESYTAGGIIARRNADTEGWSLSVNASGQVALGAYRIASNNAVALSYQSIPLNKWVHIAASYDLSGTTAAIYIDGVSVPLAKTVTGTCTALVQGTTALVVGAEKSAGTNPFDGKIAQAAVFDAVLSSATVLSYASQTLSGSETNCIACFKFNGDGNDSDANANNLTAQGGATATTVDSPFNSTEYGIVTANSFSTNTTLTVQVPEGYAIPTSGGVSAVAYSTQDVPYGFVRDKSKWRVQTLIRTALNKSSASTSTWYYLNTGLSVPTGSWVVGYKTLNNCYKAAATVITQLLTLSTGSATESNDYLTSSFAMEGASGILSNYTSNTIETDLTLTTLTQMYLNVYTTTASMNNLGVSGTSEQNIIYADLAYV